MTDYEKLKQIIQTANPGIMAVRECSCPSREDIIGRPIRLADVLLALYQYTDQHYSAYYTGDILNVDDDVVAHWNLKDDNLDHQSEETKQFLINLLINK